MNRTKSPMENGVMYQFDYVENILDFAFYKIGVEGDRVDHPLMLTETLANPTYARLQAASLCFETYRIPAIGFVLENGLALRQAITDNVGVQKSCIVVACGHSCTRIVPFYNGVPILTASVRSSIGGALITDHLLARLGLKQPTFAGRLSFSTSEYLKENFCTTSLDYRQTLQQWDDHKMTDVIQFPVPDDLKAATAPSERSKADPSRWEKNAERLRAMAQMKRDARIQKDQEELSRMEKTLEAVKAMDPNDDEYLNLLTSVQCVEAEELALKTADKAAKIRKALGKPPLESDEAAERNLEEYRQRQRTFPLADVPDDELDEAQIKEKKRQRTLRAMEEGRIRARNKKMAEEAQRKADLSEQRQLFEANPEQYVSQLREKILDRVRDMTERRLTEEKNAALKAAMGSRVGNRRNNDLQRQRMKLVAEAASEEPLAKRGGRRKVSEDDGFGREDSDWEVYKLMAGDDIEEERKRAIQEEEEAELDQWKDLLKLFDSSFNNFELAEAQLIEQMEAKALEEKAIRGLLKADFGLGSLSAKKTTVQMGGEKTDGKGNSSNSAPATATSIEETFQLVLGVEKYQCPELHFQPHITGIEEAGLHEIILSVLRRLSSDQSTSVAKGGILLCGGGAKLPNLSARPKYTLSPSALVCRLQNELLMSRPLNQPIPVFSVRDPDLDAWRGGSSLSTTLNWNNVQAGNEFILTRAAFEEAGIGYLQDKYADYTQSL